MTVGGNYIDLARGCLGAGRDRDLQSGGGLYLSIWGGTIGAANVVVSQNVSVNNVTTINAPMRVAGQLQIFPDLTGSGCHHPRTHAQLEPAPSPRRA